MLSFPESRRKLANINLKLEVYFIENYKAVGTFIPEIDSLWEVESTKLKNIET